MWKNKYFFENTFVADRQADQDLQNFKKKLRKFE
jgi:hypothetical protein